MGIFSKVLKGIIPKMVKTVLSFVKTAKKEKPKKAVKGKRKATSPKEKAIAKKQKVISKKQNLKKNGKEKKKQTSKRPKYCVSKSAYGTYVRGVTTVNARYVGHPAAVIPASEMIKRVMEENAPTVNYLVQLKAEPKKENNVNQEKKPRIDEHINRRFEYIKDSTKGWFAGFTKAIKGEQVIDEKYTLENLFSGNLTIEDIPDIPEYMTMVGATTGAKYRGLWNSAKGTYDGVKMLVTEPGKVWEAVSSGASDFIEHPIQSTKKFVSETYNDIVDAVWRSTPQEAAEDAGEILGDVLIGIATDGVGKAAAGGAKMAGNKLLALGKTGAKEFAEGLGNYGKLGFAAAEGVPVNGTVKNITKSPAKVVISKTDDAGKSAANLKKGGVLQQKPNGIRKGEGKEGIVETSGAVNETKVVEVKKVEGNKLEENGIQTKAGKEVGKEITQEAAEKTAKELAEQTEEKLAKDVVKVDGGGEVDLFLPDEFYSKNLPNQVAPGTKYLPKYDEFGNVKQIKMYDDYGREIGWVDYTNHGYGNIGSPDYHTVPHWHERIYDAQNRDGMKVNHRTDINTPLGGK